MNNYKDTMKNLELFKNNLRRCHVEWNTIDSNIKFIIFEECFIQTNIYENIKYFTDLWISRLENQEDKIIKWENIPSNQKIEFLLNCLQLNSILVARYIDIFNNYYSYNL